MVNGHHTWQSAIALIASSGDIGNDLELEVVDSSVAEALAIVMDEIKYNPNFRPVETAIRPEQGDTSVATTIFLVSSMTAPNSSVYRENPTFDDALRRNYLNGTRSYENIDQVRKDFDIWEIRYDVGYITSIVFIVIMTQCVFLFILRLFDLLLLYLAARPLPPPYRWTMGPGSRPGGSPLPSRSSAALARLWPCGCIWC